jgi:hypothetical protein
MEKLRGFCTKPRGLKDFELFLNGKSRGPCPQARGPTTLSVHHGPRIEDLPELTSAAGLGSLPQLHREGEEDEWVLTSGCVG